MHDVIAAIVTAPWSSSNSVPSSRRDPLLVGRPAVAAAGGVVAPVVGCPAAVAALVARRRVAGGEGLVGGLVDLGGLGPVRLLLGGHAVLLGPALGGAVVDVVGQRGAEGLLGVGERHPVLGALGPGERGHDRGEVELEPLGVARLGVGVVPEALLLGVRLDQRDLLRRAAGELEVLRGLLVDREDRDRGAELRAHVADRGAVGQRQRGDAGAVELHELPDDAVLAQHLGDGEHEVGGGRALGQVAVELEADHARDQHRHGLAEHRGLGLDAADAPADDADAVDHRGVGVGADAGVGVGLQHRLAVEPVEPRG